MAEEFRHDTNTGGADFLANPVTGEKKARTHFLNIQDLEDYEKRTGIKVKTPIIHPPVKDGISNEWVGDTKPEPKVHKPLFEWAEDIEPEPVKWLWEPYFLDENINIFGGETGTGKTWNLCAIAAAITNGQPEDMPGLVMKTGNVLYMGGEDGNTGMRNRLDAVGADTSKVALIERMQITLLQDLKFAIERVEPALVIIDPLMSFVNENTKSNEQAAIRHIMDSLRDLARRYHTCIIAVVHPPKRGDYKLLYRFTGSGAFVDSTRTATYIGYHPSEGNKRVGIQPKNNAAKGRTAPYVFELDSELGFSWKGDDKSITPKQVESATGYEQEAGTSGSSLNYFVAIIEAVLKVNPEGLQATANDILKEYAHKVRAHNTDSKSFGHALNKDTLIGALARRGITLRKGTKTGNKQKYSVYYTDYKPIGE